MADMDRTIRSRRTVKTRRLGKELKRLREAAGMTHEEVAPQLDLSTATISRLENGLIAKPRKQDIQAMCAIYGVQDAELVGRLVMLAAEARAHALGWWTAYGDFLSGAHLELEWEASAIRIYQLALIPGLFQTSEYAAEIIRAALVRDPEEIERRVAARMARQQLLHRDDPAPPQVWAVIDETALIRPVGSPQVRRDQLQKLLDTARLDHVTLQILPLAAGPHACLSGPFSIFDFPESTDDSIVFLETATDSLFLERPKEVDRHTLLFHHAIAAAWDVDRSLEELSRMIQQL